MKSVPKPLIIGILAFAGFLAWFLLRGSDRDEVWLGYVEGETLYVAAPVSGRLAQRPVDRGASVAPGTPLFSLDPDTLDASVSQAQAQVASSEAQAEDLTQARQRQAEIDVWRANAAQAQAALTKASNDFTRMAALADKGFASKAQLDAARAARDGASAQLAQMQAQIRAAEMTAGRAQQIRAAQAGVAGAQAALRGQQKLRSEIAPVAPARGIVEQTFYNPGEWVPANSPVVAVLPDDRRKLRFYVPQDRVAGIKVGTTIRFTCDGCGDVRQAKISFIAPRSEYTPPVIYSERARAKLVFMVEALLPVSDKPLPLGLPVEVVPQ
ncbi:HlyD family secretion protein [Novosphingobium sp. TH158]|uniref:HlyD family secretion protein n=1 Tax=Novosphingobium sp. TH158 TaxID=2067455 RepID=UPI000C7D570D|nr:HlyD family efflux transporter periplasmic adaptor subunit [Novosphingobium sp. TH158]PLK26059.1 secretion protein HlyD [Novosphingobium sp. TH158]